MGRRIVNLSLNEEGDRAIIRWLDAQENKSAAIREALEAWIGGAGGLTLGDVHQAVKALERKIGGLECKIASGALVVGTVGHEPEEEIPADVLDNLDNLGL